MREKEGKTRVNKREVERMERKMYMRKVNKRNGKGGERKRIGESGLWRGNGNQEKE